MSVQVRYFAAARDAAGCADEAWSAPDEADTTVGEIVARLVERHGEPLSAVLDRCSFLVDGRRSAPEVIVPSGAVVDVLPPFAGG